jgi:hypothetical protein
MFLTTLRLNHGCFIWLALAITVTAQASDSSAPAATDAESNAIIVDVLDPAFDRYVDLALLAPAVEQGDAGILTDLALQAAFGESILERSHKAVTSKELASLALKVAAEKKDNKSLDRLGKLAEKSGDDDLKAEITLQKNLAGASRAVPSAMISLDPLTVDDLITFKRYSADIELAVRLGDGGKLEHIHEADLTTMPDALQAKIKDAIEAADEKLANSPKVLTKLLAVSRACSSASGGRSSSGGFGSAWNGGYNAFTPQQPNQGFNNPNQGFNNPNQGFNNPNQGFNNPNQGFNNPNQGFNNPNQGFNNPNQGFNSPNVSR